jgi:hypothetical protein
MRKDLICRDYYIAIRINGMSRNESRCEGIIWEDEGGIQNVPVARGQKRKEKGSSNWGSAFLKAMG